MENTPQNQLHFKIAERRWFRTVALLLAVASTAGFLFASSDDAWEEFRQDVSAKMEKAIAGKFASHSTFVEPFGSESYGLAIASGVSAGNKQPLTIFGIYQKSAKTLEVIEAEEAVFERKAAAAGDQKTAETKPKGATKSTVQLLQGKWRHRGDKNNLLVFEKNVRKESSDGGKTWEETTFVLGDRCTNPGDAATSREASKDSYISSADDLCWHIDAVTEKELALTYVGRGNVLDYTRVTK